MSRTNQLPGPAGYQFPTATDLPEETRVQVIQHLNQSLADTTDLATQLKFAHWNVKGMNFYQLHLLFDEVAEVLEEHADMLAERATSLGGQAMGTARMAAVNSRIPELTPEHVTGMDFVEVTTEHLAIHANNLRSAIDYAAGLGDEDTADLYTEISREVDQQLYFLESHLQTQPAGPLESLEGEQVPVEAGNPQSTGQQGRPVGQQGQPAGQQGQPPVQQGQPPQRTTFVGPQQGQQPRQ